MRRPPVSWIALGTLVLASMAVIVAAGSSAPAETPASTTTSATSTTPPPSGYSDSCAVERDVAPAPGIGTATAYDAADAGSAKITRTDQTELEVTEVTPKSGWTGTETVAKGQGVKVKFISDDTPKTRVHLAVTLNNSGTEVHIRTMTCESQS
jgi:hypothetical protein